MDPTVIGYIVSGVKFVWRSLRGLIGALFIAVSLLSLFEWHVSLSELSLLEVGFVVLVTVMTRQHYRRQTLGGSSAWQVTGRLFQVYGGLCISLSVVTVLILRQFHSRASLEIFLLQHQNLAQLGLMACILSVLAWQLIGYSGRAEADSTSLPTSSPS